MDLIVICGYLACVVLLGAWTGRGNHDLSDYLLAGRNLPWWALLGSIVATETSTATFLSVPGLSYVPGGDMRFLQLALGYIVGRVLVVWLLLPAYFEGDMFTAYEVLRERFGVTAQRFTSALFLIARNVGDGLRLFLTALAIEAATGLSLTNSVILVSVVTILYTLFGGMRSVVWNDCLQLLVYFIGGIVTLWLLVSTIDGGWDRLLAFGVGEHKFRLFDFSWDLSDPMTFWAGLIGGSFLSLGTHGTDQMIVQRLLSARSQREAAQALTLSGVLVLVQFALFLLIGVALALFFAEHPPSGTIDRGDAAYIEYIVRHMPSGLAGLVLASVFAAAMSTLSSSLNSSAATLVGDFSRPSDGSSAVENQRLQLSRGFTIIFGVIQAGLAIVAAQLSQSVVLDALAIAGFTAGVMLGVFSIGLFIRRAGQSAAVLGMIAGLAVLGVVKFQTLIAWPWYPLIGSLTTVFTSWALSWFLPANATATAREH
ncbi:MAG: sodium:solute symporter [Planctomycetaceae bacterium]